MTTGFDPASLRPGDVAIYERQSQFGLLRFSGVVRSVDVDAETVTFHYDGEMPFARVVGREGRAPAEHWPEYAEENSDEGENHRRRD